MPRLVPLLLASVSLGFAPAPFLAKKLTPEEADLKALQGKWVLVSISDGLKGFSPAGGEWAEHWCVFDGRTCRSYERGVMYAKSSFTLDAAATPRRYEADVEPAKGDKWRSLSIYKLERDTLTMANMMIAKEHPKDFTPREWMFIAVYKRIRP
jgi:uncharacterized protein (TIGR03067 family)